MSNQEPPPRDDATNESSDFVVTDGSRNAAVVLTGAAELVGPPRESPPVPDDDAPTEHADESVGGSNADSGGDSTVAHSVAADGVLSRWTSRALWASWLGRQRWIGKIDPVRLSWLIVALAVIALVWWTMTPIIPSPASLIDLTPQAKFAAQLDQIRRGESTQLYVPEFPIDDSMLDPLPTESGLTTVLIDQGIVTDAGLAKIAEVAGLQHLRLRLSPITDDGLGPLLRCRDLWVLNLPHCELTVAGVESLAALTKLRQLRLGSTRLSNDVSHALTKLTSLRSVHLIGVPVTDDGLKEIAALPQLESLYLDDSAVTEMGWIWLFRNHPELHVHVNQDHHDRDPKAHAHH